jgi:hypothetical protein
MKLSTQTFNENVNLRLFPYPYQAMLAICSDLDETPDKNVYFETMRFLNTTEETTMGRGVGLEVGNTIYFDMPPGQFAYWNTDDMGREMVRNLIRSGHIDCLHSYGDLATTREHAGRALDELDRHGCRLKVWVDHGTAPTNFDGDIMQGSGDVPGSPAYHADLTIGSGVKYVWRGRVTSIIGQNIQRQYKGIWNASHPLCSSKTLLKEFSKGLLGRYGNKKYAMHAPNRILQKINLRDGQQVFEFMRCNPHWGGVGLSATAFGLSNILTKNMLQELITHQGCCILYTHLGKIGSNSILFSPETQKALILLSQFSQEKKILVATTQRLLGYCRTKTEVTISTKFLNNTFHINLYYMGHQDNLAGLTIYIPEKIAVKFWINNNEIYDFLQNPPDQTGQWSISLPWKKLEFLF